MRALHVIPAVASRYGGPSTAIWPMTAALRECSGIDVEIATTDADGGDARLTAGDLPDDAGTVHLFARDGGERLKRSRSLAQWLTVHARDYDVIHVHSTWNDPATAACRAARRSGVPYIIRPCGMLSSFSWGRSRWKKQAYWWLRERANIRDAAAFHATSEGERRDLEDLGVSAPVEVIPLAVADEAWSVPAEPNWLREQCPQAENRPIVLFLSRIHPKKGLTDLLLPAFARVKCDAFLALAGGNDDHAPGYARVVAREIERLGLAKRVALLGPVEPERRWAVHDGATLFVLPSHSENFGIVVAEAMARAKAVVVTTGVQFAEHVAAAGAGSVVQPDIDELAAALDLWLGDPMARGRAGGSGQRYIRRHFSWSRTAERLAELYERICERRESKLNACQ